MKSPYYEAVRVSTGKTIIKARCLQNLLDFFNFAPPVDVAIYEVHKKKIL